MPTVRPTPKSIDKYIASFSPEVQAILAKIRLTIRNIAPDAQETISYNIPTFTLNGVLVHFAAFKEHIGFYPPVRGDAKLETAVSRYAGEKAKPIEGSCIAKEVEGVPFRARPIHHKFPVRPTPPLDHLILL